MGLLAIRRCATGAFLTCMIASPAMADGFRFLMIEQPGCGVCAAFNRDIAPIYAVSPENGFAPLVHADIREPLPDGIILASRPYLTPTFVLIGPDGNEVGRLTGFPGEDFFWPYVGEMFDQARVALSN